MEQWKKIFCLVISIVQFYPIINNYLSYVIGFGLFVFITVFILEKRANNIYRLGCSIISLILALYGELVGFLILKAYPPGFFPNILFCLAMIPMAINIHHFASEATIKQEQEQLIKNEESLPHTGNLTVARQEI